MFQRCATEHGLQVDGDARPDTRRRDEAALVPAQVAALVSESPFPKSDDLFPDLWLSLRVRSLNSIAIWTVIGSSTDGTWLECV
jgi:hypothetical protein